MSLKTATNKINEGSILSKLWRVIIADRDLINRLDGLLLNYSSRYKPNKYSISTIKKKSLSTIREDAYGTSITWKSFINLLFNVLKIKSLRVIVELEHETGEISCHELKTLANPNITVGSDGTLLSKKDMVLISPTVINKMGTKVLEGSKFGSMNYIEVEDLQYQVIGDLNDLATDDYIGYESSATASEDRPIVDGKFLDKVEVDDMRNLWIDIASVDDTEINMDWIEKWQ